MFCCFLSIFAYFFIPDKSVNANRQIPELALADAMSQYTLLRIPKPVIDESSSPFYALFFGQKEKFIYQAITNYTIDSSHITYTTVLGRPGTVSYSDISPRLESDTDIKQQFIQEGRFFLGSDRYGRDIFSRLILGIRVSLLVGFIAVIISVVIGIFMGSTAGYFGGWWDRFVMLCINTSWSIPTLLLVFAIVMALGRGLWVIFLAVGLTMWVDVARIVRGQVLQLREQQFVLAARSLAYSDMRIIWKHLLPNILGPVLVVAAANFAIAILIEAGLSYLGFGIKPPTPSLGVMLNENYGYAISGKPLIALFPALMIMLLVLSFNFLGTGLRDVFDIKRK